MRLVVCSVALILVLPFASTAGEVYKYQDENGEWVITDKPPPDSSDYPKQILNGEGVEVGTVEGKKTPQQIAEEEKAKALAAEIEREKRADQALLNTYVSVDEIIMHRDRRLELYQSQAKVTELYLRNSRRQLESLQREARRFKPYRAVAGHQRHRGDDQAAGTEPGQVP